MCSDGKNGIYLYGRDDDKITSVLYVASKTDSNELNCNEGIKVINPSAMNPFTMFETNKNGKISLYNPVLSCILKDVDEYVIAWNDDPETGKPFCLAVGLCEGLPSQIARVSSSKDTKREIKTVSQGIANDYVLSYICVSDQKQYVITEKGTILFSCSKSASIKISQIANKDRLIYLVEEPSSFCNNIPSIELYSSDGSKIII